MRALVAVLMLAAAVRLPAQQEHRYLYAAGPSDEADTDRSIRILVFDIADAHRFVKRIVLWPAPPPGGEPETVRGIAAAAKGGRLFISTTRRLAAIDLATGRPIWEKSYQNHCCERMAVSPDGQTIYAPAFGSAQWYVINAATGELRAAIDSTGWPRQTAYSPDGRRAYLAAWESRTLDVADTAMDKVVETVGPFSGYLCPFTLNAKGTMAFANVDGFVGFEVVDLQTGLLLDNVSVDDVDKSLAAEYECPSHGIEFTRDWKELWIADGVRNRLHVFDATVYPPVVSTSIGLGAQPRWITFSMDGRYAYPSTGDVIDVKTRRIIGALKDGAGVKVSSEDLIEVASGLQD